MKWTHKVVYKNTGQWWMAALRDGFLHHNGLHEEGERPGDREWWFEIKEPTIEAYYNSVGHKVIKLKTFKGNL